MKEIIEAIASLPKGDWSSLSVNVTQGPKEGPQISFVYLPDTTRENAIAIQVAGQQLAAASNAAGEVKTS